MFKKVLPALVLMSSLGVLLLPMAASALVACTPSCSITYAPCDCGGTTVTVGNPKFCWGGTAYNLNQEGQERCIAAQVAGSGSTQTSGGSLPPAGITDVGQLVGKINQVVSWVFAFVIGVAAIFILMAGFSFMTASGNETKVTKARIMLTNALIGVAIAIGVKGLMVIIGNFIGVDIGGFLDF